MVTKIWSVKTLKFLYIGHKSFGRFRLDLDKFAVVGNFYYNPFFVLEMSGNIHHPFCRFRMTI